MFEKIIFAFIILLLKFLYLINKLKKENSNILKY